MADYINRTELIENLKKFAPEYYNALINQLITKQPTADVVEVVRCKKCKHFDSHPEDLYGHCVLSGDYQGNYEYCSYGERKEGVE